MNESRFGKFSIAAWLRGEVAVAMRPGDSLGGVDGDVFSILFFAFFLAGGCSGCDVVSPSMVVRWKGFDFPKRFLCPAPGWVVVVAWNGRDRLRGLLGVPWWSGRFVWLVRCRSGSLVLGCLALLPLR